VLLANALNPLFIFPFFIQFTKITFFFKIQKDFQSRKTRKTTDILFRPLTKNYSLYMKCLKMKLFFAACFIFAGGIKTS
jgi:hypothetical protein